MKIQHALSDTIAATYKLMEPPSKLVTLLLICHSAPLVNVGDDDPWVDRVDSDPLCGHLDCCCPRQLVQRGLAHVVGHNSGK